VARRARVFGLSGLLLVGACAAPPEPPRVDRPAPRAPTARATVPCVSLGSVAQAVVLDAAAVDFQMRDGRVLRNALGAACPALAESRTFTHAPEADRLCRGDAITVLTKPYGAGPSCVLGLFVATDAP